MKFFCLINPVAGGRNGNRLFSKLKKLQTADKFNGCIEILNQKEIPQQLKRAKDFDKIIIAGGDGTIAEVMSSMDESFPALGILPLGTGNDLARELGVQSKFSFNNLEKILEYYKTAKTKDIRIWKLKYGQNFENSIKFINYVSFGMDAAIVDTFTSLRKSKNYKLISKLGANGNRLTYALAGMRHCLNMLSLKDLIITSDSVRLNLPTQECRALIFTNIKSMMGLGISNNQSSYFDDKVELVITDSILNYLSMILKLKGPFSKPKFISSAQYWKIENIGKVIPVQIDGESKPEIRSESYIIEKADKLKIIIF